MAVVAVVEDRTELRIRLVVLRRAPDPVELRRIGRDVERDLVGVPPFEQSHARGTLVGQLQDARRRELPLQPRIPVQDVGGAHVRVVIRGIASAVVRAHEGRGPVRQHVERKRRRSLTQVEGDVGVAGRLLDARGREVFVEVLAQVVGPEVERIYREPAAEHPLLHEIVSQADSRLKVVEILGSERPLGM